MSNFNVPWFIEGANHSANVARNFMHAALGGKQGLVLSGDCEVLAQPAASSSVRVVPGTVVATATGLPDETYVARLPVEETVAISATGSSTRSDLIVARVLNPALETPPSDWPGIDPDIGPFAQAYVYEDVPPGTVDISEVDAGASGITLARVDLPANTASITQAMIVDLRPAPVAPLTEAEGATKADVATLQTDVATLQTDVATLQAEPDAAAAASGSITIEPGDYLVQGAVGLTNGSAASDVTIRLDVLAGAATGTGNGSTVGTFSNGKENIADFWMVTVTATATLQLAVAGLSPGGVVYRQHLAAFTR